MEPRPGPTFPPGGAAERRSVSVKEPERLAMMTADGALSGLGPSCVGGSCARRPCSEADPGRPGFTGTSPARPSGEEFPGEAPGAGSLSLKTGPSGTRGHTPAHVEF